jgi:hypothetical protein
VPQNAAPKDDEGAFLGETGQGDGNNDLFLPVSVPSSLFESVPTSDAGASTIVVPIASTSTVSFLRDQRRVLIRYRTPYRILNRQLQFL